MVSPRSGFRRSDLRPLGFDLLRLPLLGRFLRWRHARLCLQVPLLLLAAVIDLRRLARAPRSAPMNLAGVLPWIHWRGLLVLGLLVAGNVFCMACPFMLPRTIARRWLPQGRSWPRWLRNKWLAVVLLVWLPLGVRGVRSLGQPVVDRLDRAWLLRGCLRDRRFLSRCVLLQIRVPDRPVQLRAVADFAAGNPRCAIRLSVRRAGRRTASGAGRIFRDVSCTCTSRGSRATWTAHFASTASTPVLMTTSAFLPTAARKSIVV